ncbi:outer membrane lipoprotein carrier protein LolA [Alicyclobacillus mali]|uniref:Outer membrane lipoprotein carrier protein LolA n=1 Tax=Alicyclobacillus mali (ex Roth et al. 2021) TaxID=1123961 RepID=A0ABS0F4A3_9BACL|nr:outer membrane lipoprotein carrier protein LolA [Alicyclobacillus mali (ex Roth et al. 2021)]MBF8378145.1 outer membrane lipoprotein carrier protein LolA [Alicyclobacillus mali (ex Roth et al. 2021)]
MAEKGEVAMRKLTAVLLSLALAGGVVAGCGIPGTTSSVNHKIQSEAQAFENKNYQSEAIMTVQMDNNVQKYFVRVSYESKDMYKIELGNADKQINQVIVRTPNGMFIVSPSLGKVFRFNGNWAQNQGQIYLYDQLLQRIASDKSVKVSREKDTYAFEVPVVPASDVVSREQIVLSKDLKPQSVTLLDKNGKAAVVITYQSFETGVEFPKNAFDPQTIAQAGQAAKPTLASDHAFDYIEPPAMYGTKLTDLAQPDESSIIMRYQGGGHHYVLTESALTPGAAGLPSAELVDLYGTPAIYDEAPGTQVANLTWMQNGIEFDLTSNDLSLPELENIAISTFAEVGK